MIEILKARSGNCCELCGATENLGVYTVPPAKNESTERTPPRKGNSMATTKPLKK